MSNASTSVIRFLRIEADGTEDFKVHSAIGSIFYKDSPWSRYRGAGSLISISPVEDTSRTTGSVFNINLKLPNEGLAQQDRIDIITQARNKNLIDQAVAAYDYTAGITPEPVLILLAQVESVRLSTDGRISIDCYTAAAQMDRVYYKPTICSDAQQSTLVDKEDRGLRFANIQFSEAGLEFP